MNLAFDTSLMPPYIIKRLPLVDTARRSGWVGCNIDISKIADAGKVFLVKNAQIIDPAVVRETFHKTLFLRTVSKDSKGWILDVMSCIDSIKKENFTLADLYQFEYDLKLKYSNNNFVKEKIRQQLQVLRDQGIIEFVRQGNYKKITYKNI